MNTQDIMILKEKIEEAKVEKAKAEGAMEQIEKKWKEDFSCNSVQEVEKKIKDSEDQVNTLKEKLDSYLEEISDIMEEANA